MGRGVWWRSLGEDAAFGHPQRGGRAAEQHAVYAGEGLAGVGGVKGEGVQCPLQPRFASAASNVSLAVKAPNSLLAIVHSMHDPLLKELTLVNR